MWLDELKEQEEGQGMVEYGLLVVLMAVVVAVSFPAVANAVLNALNKAKDQLNKS